MRRQAVARAVGCAGALQRAPDEQFGVDGDGVHGAALGDGVVHAEQKRGHAHEGAEGLFESGVRSMSWKWRWKWSTTRWFE